jgi:hypothetical protein
MSIRSGILATVAVVMTCVSPITDGARAAPMSAVPAIETTSPHAIKIGSRRGWGWGVGAGVVGGVIIGRALTRPYYYDPYYPRVYDYYAGPAYYPDGYYARGRVYYSAPYREAPAYDELEDADAEAYCIRRFRSYDPESGTYLGYDGRRHPCP